MIALTDVTLRDGLQMEARTLSTVEKLESLRRLLKCGYDRYEITSFINPKWLPQFADADAFAELVAKEFPKQVNFMAFVPNERGLDRLIQFPITWAGTFIAVSETFNKKNINQSVKETLDHLGPLIAKARSCGRKMRVYVSTVFGCPYEGKIPEIAVAHLVEKVAKLGPDEIALSDTIGVALPDSVQSIVAQSGKLFPLKQTALHFHNTYGMAMANALAGWKAGVALFDGSSGGIGGCPYAKGATGNVATEDLAYTFTRLGARKDFYSEEVMALLKAELGAGLIPQGRVAEILMKGGTLYG